jgi:hypothetical protein
MHSAILSGAARRQPAGSADHDTETELVRRLIDANRERVASVTMSNSHNWL